MSHHLANDHGLVCAFQITPVAACGDDVLDSPVEAAPRWLHFNLANVRARRWLEESAGLPAAAREILRSTEQRIHAEALPGGFVAVLGDLDHDFHGDPEGFNTLFVYVDQHRMITARRHALKTTDALRREMLAGSLQVKTPLALFEHFVERLAQTVGTVVSNLGDAVDDIEERILSGHLGSQGEALGRMRRSLARLRRHVNANRAALGPLPRRLPEPYTAEQRQDLRQGIERLDAVGGDLELVQERARLVQEEVASRLTEATNRNLFLLSIVTTTLLPITLITGMFGMNVGGLPWLEHPKGFWWVIVVMLLAVVVTLVLLRRRRVL